MLHNLYLRAVDNVNESHQPYMQSIPFSKLTWLTENSSLGQWVYNARDFSYIYCRANQEWQLRNILFTIVELNINLHTLFEITRIDRSLVY